MYCFHQYANELVNLELCYFLAKMLVLLMLQHSISSMKMQYKIIYYIPVEIVLTLPTFSGHQHKTLPVSFLYNFNWN